jgi:hypothetical protein
LAEIPVRLETALASRYAIEREIVLATVQTQPAFTITSRRPLFPVSDIVTASPHSNYDVSPDVKRFLMVRLNPSSRIMVIQNLPALVRKLGGATRATP